MSLCGGVEITILGSDLCLNLLPFSLASTLFSSNIKVYHLIFRVIMKLRTVVCKAPIVHVTYTGKHFMNSSYFCDYPIHSLRAGSLLKPFLVVSTGVDGLRMEVLQPVRDCAASEESCY